MKAEIGVYGLGVMGTSLSRNIARNGFKIAIYNRHLKDIEENVAINVKKEHPELKNALPFDDIKGFLNAIERPLKIILMVNAGNTIDKVIDQLKPYLLKGDIIIDGGNSHYKDTERRIDYLNSFGIHFLGVGISGGKEGAFLGPSIMPSGDFKSYDVIKSYLNSIAAKDGNGKACTTYVGQGGSGHFVKMIHNGIEYVEMQLIAECYSIFKNQKLSNEGIADLFESWIEVLDSYLLRISIEILRKKKGSKYILDTILDKATGKGTGSWASSEIAQSGVANTLIPSALFSRFISSLKEKRVQVAKIFGDSNETKALNADSVKSAYKFGRIINHYQGFEVIKLHSEINNWNINLSEIARIWTEGCIIKSDFMIHLVDVLKGSSSIIFHEEIIKQLNQNYSQAKETSITSIQNELHIPCMLESLNFFNGLKTQNSSANLIQAQRDFFGSHGYEKIDDNTGKIYYSNWKEDY